MTKLLIGTIGEKVDRSAFGRFASKKKARVFEVADKAFIVGSDNDVTKLKKEFGDGQVRSVQKSDADLKSVKLSDIR